jgi:hypothetical protein
MLKYGCHESGSYISVKNLWGNPLLNRKSERCIIKIREMEVRQ